MKIGIAGSMQFSEKMLEVRDQLRARGHEAFVPEMIEPFLGKSDEEKEVIKLHQKLHDDAILALWKPLQSADALLVLNLEKHGVPNYIGGNTFLEIGFAHVLGLKIFLWNPIPENPLYASEIRAINPVVIDGDLELIR